MCLVSNKIVHFINFVYLVNLTKKCSYMLNIGALCVLLLNRWAVFEYIKFKCIGNLFEYCS